jgi:2-acylglycerol O-acyltransferase 2
MANPIMALWRRYFSFAVCYEQMLDPHQHYLFADYPHGAFPLSQLLALTVRHLACWQGVSMHGLMARAVTGHVGSSTWPWLLTAAAVAV